MKYGGVRCTVWDRAALGAVPWVRPGSTEVNTECPAHAARDRAVRAPAPVGTPPIFDSCLLGAAPPVSEAVIEP